MQLALQFLSIIVVFKLGWTTLKFYSKSSKKTFRFYFRFLSNGDSYRLGVLHLWVWIQTVASHLPSRGAVCGVPRLGQFHLFSNFVKTSTLWTHTSYLLLSFYFRHNLHSDNKIGAQLMSSLGKGKYYESMVSLVSTYGILEYNKHKTTLPKYDKQLWNEFWFHEDLV
jgi:hypothetical protein